MVADYAAAGFARMLGLAVVTAGLFAFGDRNPTLALVTFFCGFTLYAFAVSALVGDPKAVGIYSLASLFQQVVTIPMRAYLDARFAEMTRGSSARLVMISR